MAGFGTLVVPSDALVGEDVARVDFSAVLVDFRTIDAGCAASGFKVQTDAGKVGEFVGTPGAFDVFADVYGGFEVLVALHLVDFRLMGRKRYLVEVVQTRKRSLASVAVVGRMLFINVFLASFLSSEDAGTVVTAIPMVVLLVLQAKLAVMGWPSSIAPATFNLVRMSVAVVEMLPNSPGIKSTATTFRHCERCRDPKGILAVTEMPVWEDDAEDGNVQAPSERRIYALWRGLA